MTLRDWLHDKSTTVLQTSLDAFVSPDNYTPEPGTNAALKLDMVRIVFFELCSAWV